MKVFTNIFLTAFLTAVLGQTLTTHPSPLLNFVGIYTSNFNETITFCAFHPKPFELNAWHIIPMIAQSADSGQSEYNVKGAELTGGTYFAANGSVIWRGFGFSANGPYDCAFALGSDGREANGYYTFLAQANGTTDAGETGPWLLYKLRTPTRQECKKVLREHKSS